MGMSPVEREKYYQEKIARLHTPEANAKRIETMNSPEWKAKRKLSTEEKRNFNKLARYMMEADIPDEDEARQELLEHGFDLGSYQAAVFWGQLKKAIYNLDTEAAKYVRDTAGYKPTENLNLGNADDKPFASLDLSKLSNDELLAMIAKREVIDGEE